MTAATTAASAPPRAWHRALAGAAAVWASLDALILLGTFPYWPRTAARWGLLLLAGPATYLALGGLLDLAASSRRWPGRAGAVVLVALGAVLVALGAWWTLGVEGP